MYFNIKYINEKRYLIIRSKPKKDGNVFRAHVPKNKIGQMQIINGFIVF